MPIAISIQEVNTMIISAYTISFIQLGVSCSWKQLFAAGSTEVKHRSFKQNGAECLRLSDHSCNGIGTTAMFQHMMQLGFTIHMTTF